MDVFDLFDLTGYTFAELKRGGVVGNEIVSAAEASGVFKHRTGMVSADNRESTQSSSTLHIRPTEPFLTSVGADVDPEHLIGHGIRCQGRDYEIEGATGGDNYESGKREHYRVTLKASDFSTWQGKDKL